MNLSADRRPFPKAVERLTPRSSATVFVVGDRLLREGVGGRGAAVVLPAREAMGSARCVPSTRTQRALWADFRSLRPSGRDAAGSDGKSAAPIARCCLRRR